MAVAKADGSVDLFEWELEQVSYGFSLTNSVLSFLILPTHSKTQKQLRHASTLRVAPSHVLCLSLDWSNRKVPTRYASTLHDLRGCP